MANNQKGNEKWNRQSVYRTKSAGKKGIPGSTLKIIAIITMFIDHIGAVVLEGK